MGLFEIVVGLVVVAGGAIVSGVLLFIVARRAMKFMVRAAIFGVILVALLVGGVTFWFMSSTTAEQGRPASRPANSKRRQP